MKQITSRIALMALLSLPFAQTPLKADPCYDQEEQPSFVEKTWQWCNDHKWEIVITGATCVILGYLGADYLNTHDLESIEDLANIDDNKKAQPEKQEPVCYPHQANNNSLEDKNYGFANSCSNGNRCLIQKIDVSNFDHLKDIKPTSRISFKTSEMDHELTIDCTNERNQCSFNEKDGTVSFASYTSLNEEQALQCTIDMDTITLSECQAITTKKTDETTAQYECDPIDKKSYSSLKVSGMNCWSEKYYPHLDTSIPSSTKKYKTTVDDKGEILAIDYIKIGNGLLDNINIACEDNKNIDHECKEDSKSITFKDLHPTFNIPLQYTINKEDASISYEVVDK
jgi:hypothetical protein